MKKTVVMIMLIAALALSLVGCGKAPAAQNTAPAAEAQTPAEAPAPAAETPAEPAATQTEPAETPEAEAFPARADGERFEDVIMIEGMEETVQYEHVKSAAFGFEMDYDYENFVRQSDAKSERFVSVWDDPNAPENYIEVRSDTGNAELVADVIIATLSQDYDIRQEIRCRSICSTSMSSRRLTAAASSRSTALPWIAKASSDALTICSAPCLSWTEA